MLLPLLHILYGLDEIDQLISTLFHVLQTPGTHPQPPHADLQQASEVDDCIAEASAPLLVFAEKDYINS